MTEPRRTPTPGDLAAVTPAATLRVGPPYERTRWEAAVLERRLHRLDVLVALVLAHYAGPGGILPEDGIQRTDRLRDVAPISPESIRAALRNLENRGLITRLPLNPGSTSEAARAIALTIPARRQRPPRAGRPR
ncbi:hypothetical protein F9278_36315 [Streptomyces phaeolivaceus]|uniref:Uncharacterized protein n=1 Tax=Streptomyces phaeolivaceus TaxID=2653200 RepID=A0A5P8KC75_9ACTN|nr:hypothetical protein [Streptomyces phaeolivaceus]QFR00742.1 hypothetical protein F9278_36315 [Streptomyces phaeolivaceus]